MLLSKSLEIIRCEQTVKVSYNHIFLLVFFFFFFFSPMLGAILPHLPGYTIT